MCQMRTEETTYNTRELMKHSITVIHNKREQHSHPGILESNASNEKLLPKEVYHSIVKLKIKDPTKDSK